MDHGVNGDFWGVNNVLLHKVWLVSSFHTTAELRAQMYKSVYLRIDRGSPKHSIAVLLISLHYLNSS